MAVRILLVLLVLAIFYGCGQSSSPPEQTEKEGGTEPQSVSPSGSAQQVTSATASASEQLLTNAAPSDSGQRVKSTTPVGPGKQLVFGIRAAGYDLYAMNRAGSNPIRLTDGAGPAWSPDGKQIAYTRYLKEPNPAASSAPASASPAPFIETPYIFIMNADGSGGKQLLGRASLEPEWSPEGKEIAFTLYPQEEPSIGRASAYCGIYIMDADGSDTPRKLATGPGCASSPAWSPDGKEIAYVSHPGLDVSGNEKSEIYVANAPSEEGHTNQPRALTDRALGTAYDPSWSPDGTEIAFTFENQDGRTSIYKMDADGGGMKPIALFQHMKKLEASSAGWPVYDSKFYPVWSPDGEQIAYVRLVPDCDSNCAGGHYTSYPSTIYVMNSDGSDPTLIRDFGRGHDVWGLDWRALP